MGKTNINITIDEDLVTTARLTPNFNLSGTINDYLREFFSELSDEVSGTNLKELEREHEKLKQQFVEFKKIFEAKTVELNIARAKAKKLFEERMLKSKQFRDTGMWTELNRRIDEGK